MRKHTTFLLIAALSLFTVCSSKRESKEQAWKTIYQQKGFSTMTDMLLPEMIETNIPFSPTASLRGKDRFACISGTEFGFGTFTNDLEFTYEPIVKGFAGDAVGRLGADENGTIMWGKQGYSGFLAVDTLAKDTLDIVPSISLMKGSDIFRAYLTELPGKVLLFYLDGQPKYMLYDFLNKRELFVPNDTSRFKINNLYKISKTTYLLETFNKTITWYISELTNQGFDNIRTNSLTESLTQKGFSSSAWTSSRPFHSDNRMLIGTIEVAGRTVNAVAHWDSEYKNVRIEPLIMQCPAAYDFSTDNWTFSLDGKWLYNTATKRRYGGGADPELVFYHVDPKYPQGISPPVFAGLSGAAAANDEELGCFVEHSKLGTVFIDVQTNPRYVLVYKMSGMAEIIAKKLRAMAGGS